MVSVCMNVLGKDCLHFSGYSIHADKYSETLEHYMLLSRHLFQRHQCIFPQYNPNPHSPHITHYKEMTEEEEDMDIAL